MLTLLVTPEAADRRPEARQLAARLELDLAEEPPAEGLLLVYTQAGLELRQAGPGAPGPVRVDFLGGPVGYRQRRREGPRQPLGRALGLKGGRRPRVIDATAGLGRDGFLLASWGCRVWLLERSPVIAALLADGLRRAAADPEARTIVERLHLEVGDSLEQLARLAPEISPEVIYLDPMHPARTKAALVKKEMRLLRAMVGEDQDAPLLLEAALAGTGGRVVVKRPRLAPAIEGKRPSLTVTGKNSRYDVYLVHA